MKQTVSRRVLQALFACALVAQTSAVGATADSLRLAFSPAPFSNQTHGDTVIFECSGMPLLSIDDVVAEGGCGGEITYSFSESVNIPLDPIDAGYLSIMTCNFEGVDPCGNSAQLTINIRVEDTTPPELQDVPSDLSLQAGGTIPTPAAVYAIDNCSRNLDVLLTEEDASTNSFERVIRTWSATDDAGNTSTASQQITLALPTSSTGACGNDLFDELERKVTATDCENGTEVCLPFAIASEGLFLVNDSPVNYFSCAADTLVTYNVAGLMQSAGDYEVIWDVSPGAYRHRTSSVGDLIEFMRLEQPGGDWKLDETNTMIVGNPNPRYAELKVIHAATGTQSASQPKQKVMSSQSTIVLMPGKHLLTYRLEQCVDTATVFITCATVRERSITAIRGIDATHTLPFSGSEDQYEVTILEDNLAGLLEIRSTVGPRVNFSSMISGEATMLIDLCHIPTGNCDRYLLRFEIVNRENVKPPTAGRDLFAVAYNGQRMLHILGNDEVIGEVTSLTLTPGSTGQARIDAMNRLHYTAPADWCGEDLIHYEVCNPGGCDTATVVIQVTCEELMVFNGFSPNQDGINDNFTVIGIENYPDNQLIVFNQHGHQVYATSTYNNQWDGTYNGSPLLDGTYYYVLTIKGKNTKSGYVQIKR
ncbi:MAG: gliding motility-associated C-terminal domain-containing protein [Saprospiraceae bacterium]